MMWRLFDDGAQNVNDMNTVGLSVKALKTEERGLKSEMYLISDRRFCEMDRYFESKIKWLGHFCQISILNIRIKAGDSLLSGDD